MTGRLLLAAIIANLVGWSGCKEQSKQAVPTPAASAPRAAITLNLLVVEDKGLAEAVRLLRGEWAERSGGNLVVQEVRRSDFEVSKLPDSDVVVFPSQLLAEMVLEKKLRPVRRSVLESESFAFDDVLPIVRNEVMRFGGEVFAISLGEAPLMLATTSDPDDELAESDSKRLGSWQRLANLAPHKSGRPAQELIARAASLVDPRLRSELLFDPKDMTPRLSAPHFVRALQQMMQSQESSDNHESYKVACPTANSNEEDASWRFNRLPRAEETYNSIRDRWEPQTVVAPLAVVGFAGRSAGVTTSTRNATSAFKLLAWLTSGTPATRVSSGSGETTMFRNSQRQRADKWLGKTGQEAAPAIIELLSTGESYLLARIPEIEQYLGLLDESVRQARQGDESAEAILKSASDHWEELTEKLGRDRQRRCYRLHLGLEDWSD